jgi:hypothetical protein
MSEGKPAEKSDLELDRLVIRPAGEGKSARVVGN